MAQTLIDQIREVAESNPIKFIELVAPHRVLGSVHRELIEWWTRQDSKSHKIGLLPRDHGKSAIIAYLVAWTIVKRPEVRILYISSTAGLAEKQLKMIKDILTSDAVRRYWPDLINIDEGKREKWTSSEIAVDHPKRKAEGIRDSTVFTGGLTTSLTGFHCDIAVLDDAVVMENAYTDEGRTKVKSQYSLMASIEGSDSEEWVVGTRYHPKDLYNDMSNMAVDQYDSDGNICGSEPLFEKFERRVEDRGDGTGQFLWPRMQRSDGKWFGFDVNILAKKRAQYQDKTQFRAQYYNDPNDPSSSAITYETFKYYEKNKLSQANGYWTINGKRLNIISAIDFAYSLGHRSDYTSVCVVGVDGDGQYYILDIDRFKTVRIEDYYRSILGLYNRWGFRKLVAECTAAQEAIVEQLKNAYINPSGIGLSVVKVKPHSHSGSKEERMYATLNPKYENGQVWHYRGGNCQVLEDELVLQNPPHDDVKNVVADAIDHLIIPMNKQYNMGIGQANQINYNSRFGGVS